MLKEKPGIREWVRDRILFLALVIFLIGATIYILAGKIFAPESIWLHPLKEFSLLMSMIGIVSLGYELFLRELTFNEYKEALQELVNPDAVRLGVRGIYKNRSELGRAISFEGLFRDVKNEIFIGGSSLLSISTASRELLKDKVLHGANVRLLLMDPTSPVVEMISKQTGGKPTFVNEIRTSLLLLQKLQEEIEEGEGHPKKGKLTVHTYQIIPSHSFISIDADQSQGVIVADIGPYLGRSHARPSMVVVRKKGGLFEYWQEMNELMWESSKPIDLAPPQTMDSKAITQVFTSGKETEYFDTATRGWFPASICQMDGNWKGIKGSQWVWVREHLTLEESKTGSQHRFRHRLSLPFHFREEALIRGDLLVRAADVCHITVNDVGIKMEYGGAEYTDPFMVDIKKYLKGGENMIYFELISFAQPDAESAEDNRTGLIYRLHIEYRD